MFLIMCIAILSVWELYIRKKGKYIKVPFVTICGFFGIFAIVKLWQVFPLLGLYGVIIGIIKSCRGIMGESLKTEEERKLHKENQILSVIVWAGCLEILAYSVVFCKEINPDYIYNSLNIFTDFIDILQNIIVSITLILFGIGIIHIELKDYKFYKSFPINLNDKQYPAVIKRHVGQKKKCAALLLKVNIEELMEKSLTKGTKKKTRILDEFKCYEYITHAHYSRIENPVGTVFKLPVRYSEKTGKMYIVEEIIYDKQKAIKVVVAGIMIVLLGVFIGIREIFL